MSGAAPGTALSGRAGVDWPVWLMLAVALLQLAVLVQVTALRDRVVQLEAGAEFEDYAQGCLRPQTPAPDLALPGTGGRPGPLVAKGLDV
jgi:hypothetical protein